MKTEINPTYGDEPLPIQRRISRMKTNLVWLRV